MLAHRRHTQSPRQIEVGSGWLSLVGWESWGQFLRGCSRFVGRALHVLFVTGPEAVRMGACLLLATLFGIWPASCRQPSPGTQVYVSCSLGVSQSVGNRWFAPLWRHLTCCSGCYELRPHETSRQSHFCTTEASVPAPPPPPHFTSPRSLCLAGSWASRGRKVPGLSCHSMPSPPCRAGSRPSRVLFSSRLLITQPLLAEARVTI